MLVSYSTNNCELAHFNSVLRSKFQSVIYDGTLFLFETPIQPHRRFLRKFFSVEKFLGLSFTQLSCEWKSIGKVKRTFECRQKENFGQNSLLYRTRKGCVLVYMPIKKNTTIESLCNFKVGFAKGKAYFPWLNRLTHFVLKS